MNREKFIQIASNVIDYYKNFYKINKDTRLYFKFNLLNINNLRQNPITQTNYFEKFEKETCVITNSAEKIYYYLQKTYPKLKVTFDLPQSDTIKKLQKIVKIEIIGRELDNLKNLNIKDYLTLEKTKEKKLVLKYLKKQLKLKETETFKFYSFNKEENEKENAQFFGTAIISKKLYIYFELNSTKNNDLNLINITKTKIIDLDKEI